MGWSLAQASESAQWAEWRGGPYPYAIIRDGCGKACGSGLTAHVKAQLRRRDAGRYPSGVPWFPSSLCERRDDRGERTDEWRRLK